MTTKFKDSDTPLYKANKQFGDYFEQTCIPFIEEKFNKALNPIGKYLKFICDNTSEYVHELKGWDLKFGIYSLDNNQLLKTITFEIKTDKYNSWNVFFERTCSKKPSGVFVTEADYFVYMLPRHQHDNFFLAKPADLVRLLNEHKYHLSRGSGEGNRVTGWITDKDDFMEDFLNVGGKIYTWDVEIPKEFDLTKLNFNTEVEYIFFDSNDILSYKEVRMKI